jgi:SAM-dependent methyltransferase
MNRLHRWFCRSGLWQRTLETRLLPWALNGIDLGDDVLEVGPGPGLATEILRLRAKRLTSIEIDPRLAGALRDRMAGTNVAVVEGDATDMPFEEGRFSGAVAFTMLHHVPSPELQDRLFREVHRVLAPGGRFAGTDNTSSRTFELIHLFDTLVPVNPDGLGARLEKAGFAEVAIRNGRGAFSFRALRA